MKRKEVEKKRQIKWKEWLGIVISLGNGQGSREHDRFTKWEKTPKILMSQKWNDEEEF